MPELQTPDPQNPDPNRDTPMPAPTWKPEPIEEPAEPAPKPNPDENEEPTRHAAGPRRDDRAALTHWQDHPAMPFGACHAMATPPRPVPDPGPPLPEPLPPDPAPGGPIPTRSRALSPRVAKVLAAGSLLLLPVVALCSPAYAQSQGSDQLPSTNMETTRDAPTVRKDRQLPYDKTEEKTPKTEFNQTGQKSGANAAEDCYPGAKDKTEASNARNDDAHCK